MAQYPQYRQQPSQPTYPEAEVNYDYVPAQQDQESLGSWVLLTFILFIPLVNIIYLLVLAFGTTTSKAKRNFARASLIWMAVGLVVSIVLGILFAAAGASIFAELLNSYLITAL